LLTLRALGADGDVEDALLAIAVKPPQQLC